MYWKKKGVALLSSGRYYVDVAMALMHLHKYGIASCHRVFSGYRVDGVVVREGFLLSLQAGRGITAW